MQKVKNKSYNSIFGLNIWRKQKLYLDFQNDLQTLWFLKEFIYRKEQQSNNNK